MSSDILHEVTIPCEHGSLKAVSTTDITNMKHADIKKPLIIHNGMGKPPSQFRDLMRETQDAGFTPIAIDTRWYETPTQRISSKGLSWREQKVRRFIYKRSSFESRALPNPDNKYALRRVRALEHGLAYFGFKTVSLLGFSDGGRISALTAIRNPESVSQLILLNPAGGGSSWHGYKRLMRSNRDEIAALMRGEVGRTAKVRGGFVSTLYTLKHPYRVLQEKRVIQATNLWAYIDELRDTDIAVSVFAAQSDRLVSFTDIEAAASRRPWIDFTPTEGRHTNVFNESVRSKIIAHLNPLPQ